MDFVSEGIRLQMVTDVENVIKNKNNLIIIANKYQCSIDSHKLCEFLEIQSQKLYHLNTNNCLHFAYLFQQNFISINQNIKHSAMVDNSFLLNWAQNCIQNKIQ